MVFFRVDFDFGTDAVRGGSSWSLDVGRVIVTFGTELPEPTSLSVLREKPGYEWEGITYEESK